VSYNPGKWPSPRFYTILLKTSLNFKRDHFVLKAKCFLSLDFSPFPQTTLLFYRK
jgi:hypothetical protein